MHVDPSTKPSNGGGLSQSTPTCTTVPKRPSMELSIDPKNNTSSSDPSKTIKVSASLSLSLIFDGRLTVLLSSVGDFIGVNLQRQETLRGPTSYSDGEGPKIPDPKTLRRLAHNREAARKSMLRKKAYVQQIESSRIKLTQLEQELQRARTQGIFFGGEQGIPSGVTNISSDAVVFDLEHARWLEEHHKITCKLRAAVQEPLADNELKMYVDNYLAHYDVAMNPTSRLQERTYFISSLACG